MHVFTILVGAQQLITFFVQPPYGRSAYQIPSNGGERNAKKSKTNSEHIVSRSKQQQTILVRFLEEPAQTGEKPVY